MTCIKCGRWIDGIDYPSTLSPPCRCESSELTGLLPCPFCGEGKSIVECYQDDYGKWRVACGACGVHSGIMPDNDKAKVIANWNKRAM